MAEKIEVIIKATDKVSGTIKNINSSFNSLGVAAGKMATLAGAGLAAIGVGVFKLASDAAPVEQIQASFASLAEGMGSSTDKMLDELTRGSAGMIASTDLMKSFNLASSLISEDFAQKLPAAMSSLTKASGATGESMDFLLDSLVRGVGRLSPMILDNLGIQVSLTDAYESFAAANGLVVSEMTKTEQQAAVMETVMGKLGDKYGDMPDVAGSAMASFAQFRAGLVNLKDTVGLALLPAIAPLVDKFNTLSAEVLPILTNWLTEKLVPAISELAGFFMDLISGSPEDIIGSLANVVWTLASAFGSSEEEAATLFEKVIALREPFEEIKTAFNALVEDTIKPFIAEHSEGLKGALAGIAIAFGIGAIIATVTGLLAALTSPIGLIILAAGLLGMAWTENWGGIQEKTKAVWEWLQPKLQELWDWLEVNIPAAIETLKTFWIETLLPALNDVWTWMNETLFPLFQTLWDWLATNIPEAIETAKTFWTETLLPALTDVWTWITENLMPLFAEITDLFNVGWDLAITAAAGYWQNILQPALQTVGDYIKDILQPIFDTIANWLNLDGKSAVEVFETVLGTLKLAWDGITAAVQFVIEKVKLFKDELSKVVLPWWLTPGSPTPFEYGLVGISEEMENLAKNTLPQFNRSLNFTSPLSPTFGSTIGGGGVGTSLNSSTEAVTNNFNLTIQNVSDENRIISDFGLLQALAGAQ